MDENSENNGASSKGSECSELLCDLLPCPFCGAQPTKERSWMDATVYISCRCLASPCISVQATCIRNQGDTETFTPLFDEAFEIATKAWNTRT